MKLDDWRIAQKLTQTELARLLGLSDSGVSRILNGRRPEWQTLDRIFALTDGAVTPNDFLALGADDVESEAAQ